MDDAKTAVSREKLLHALYEAAELEQNLMCTYLYAAFSLKDGEGEGLSAAEGEATARWRRAILDVAIDEMSHLVAVWNITSALGGAPRFGRTNFPIDPGYLPAGIVVKLAPFSAEVVQHFIFLERFRFKPIWARLQRQFNAGLWYKEDWPRPDFCFCPDCPAQTPNTDGR